MDRSQFVRACSLYLRLTNSHQTTPIQVLAGSISQGCDHVSVFSLVAFMPVPIGSILQSCHGHQILYYYLLKLYNRAMLQDTVHPEKFIRSH